MLTLSDIHTYYGHGHVLRGLSFHVAPGKVATLLGRNGAGKSTTLRTIMGLVRPKQGTVRFDDRDITGRPPHEIAGLGIGYVPEERSVFPSLSVLENLLLPSKKGKGGLWDLEKIYGYFPVLKNRLNHSGSQLSGGEQQMLAIARILTMDVKLILLDEPTEGLAPFLVREIGRIIREISVEGTTILLVEQNTRFAVEIADEHFIIYGGVVVYQGSGEDFSARTDIQQQYLGV